MPSKPQALLQDLEIAEAMAAAFEDYLQKDVLYQQLVVHTSAGDRLPRMSAGSLLELIHSLRFAGERGKLTRDQQDRFTKLSDTVDQLISAYAGAYRAKLSRELKSQIDSWRWFLQDCREDRGRCRDEYPFEVRTRNRIALLLDALQDDAPADQLAQLEKLDQDLRGLFTPGDFILEEGLQARYPRDKYWWLYGQP